MPYVPCSAIMVVMYSTALKQLHVALELISLNVNLTLKTPLKVAFFAAASLAVTTYVYSVVCWMIKVLSLSVAVMRDLLLIFSEPMKKPFAMVM